MSNQISDHGIICPHAICDSCGANSGPILTLPKLQDCSDLLRDNSPPLGIEREITVQYIEEVEVKITQLDTEIGRLQRVIASLRDQRGVLRTFSNRRKSLLAPIRKLPEDVLRYLFVTCQLCNEPDGFIQSYCRTTFARSVTRVCSYWRILARSMPELWSRILVSSPYIRPSNSVKPGLFLEDCISLSGTTPLHIRLGRYPYTSTDLGDSCMQSLARCASRWKEMQVNDGELFGDILKCIHPDVIFSSLERLSLDEVLYSISINPTPLLSYFYAGFIEAETGPVETLTVSIQSAPCLQTFSIKSVQGPESVFVNFPWHQITTFESSNDYEENEVALLLMLMPNLVSFTLNGELESSIMETVTLLSLKTFTLQHVCTVGDGDKNVLDAFTAPHVYTLHLEFEMDYSSIFNFLTRSCCPLADLKLTKMSLHRDWVERCHSSLRTVKTLCLIFPTELWNDNLVLTRNDIPGSSHWHMSHTAFPQLRTLEFQRIQLREDRNVTHTILPLITMLKSRMAPVHDNSSAPVELVEDIKICYLQHITISFEDRLLLDEVNAFKDLNCSDLVRHSGVKMTISHDMKYKHKFVIRDGVYVHKETAPLCALPKNTDLEEESSSDEDVDYDIDTDDSDFI